MAACDLTRPLTQAEREAAFGQQRTGVGQALRPFSGSPSIENLIDYLNRELIPVLRATRNAANDVWKQVVDNAPSANPLSFYFSTTTAAADPTAGRVRLNQAVQNTATIIRVSESNGRLQSVQPWLDVMSGGPTSPLGTVTLLDAINPGRFLRFDLNTMTDQGAYWDLGVTFIEGSDASPFVDDEAVTIGFIAGVSAAGSTVPVGSLSPIATDTFLGRVAAGTGAPSAINLSTLAGAGLNFAAHTLDVTGSTSITIASDQVQRAALSGFVDAALNSNATSSAEPIVTYSASANMSAERVLTSSTSNTVSTAVSGQIALQRAALTGDVTASADSNATTIANNAVTNAKAADMASPRLKGRTTAGTGDPEDLTLVNSTTVTWNTGTGGSISVERAALTGDITASANSNTTDIAAGVIVNADINASAGINLSKLATGDSVTWTGDHGFQGQAHFQYRVLLGSALANSSTGQVDDLDVSGDVVVRFTGPPSLLTGMVSGATGQLVLLVNASTSTDITISDEHASSSASNRFDLANGATSLILRRQGAVFAFYDGTTNRWRIVRPGSEATA